MIFKKIIRKAACVAACIATAGSMLGASAITPAAATVKQASSITADQFVNAVKNVYTTAHNGHYRYGNSTATPPTTDGVISCDRLIAKALWDLGFTDQSSGGITCGNMDSYLTSHGFVRSTSFNDIRYGSIVLVKGNGINYWSHTFVTTAFNASTKRATKYDMGSQTRINSTQPFVNEAWGYRTDTVRVYNLPSNAVDASKYAAVFDADYYLANYSDLRRAFGSNVSSALNHFLKYGMKEGRVACADFNVKIYKANYSDLQRAFGNNLPAYYQHYMTYGLKEGRNATIDISSVNVSSSKPVYRIYNADSGEHFFTENVTEKNNLIKAGWKAQGVAWYAPASSSTPVYRLYNRGNGEHFYTAGTQEKNYLTKSGWKAEGVAWYGCENGKAVYRLFNPNAFKNGHYFTTNAAEKDSLVRQGWKYEGTACYVTI